MDSGKNLEYMFFVKMAVCELGLRYEYEYAGKAECNCKMR